jgi:LRP1 type putative zinc finger protein
VATERFPREVSSEALFHCVRLGPVHETGTEVAYQTSVKIAGHVFKGILHDVGPDPSSSVAASDDYFRHATDGSSPGTVGEGSVAGAGPSRHWLWSWTRTRRQRPNRTTAHISSTAIRGDQTATTIDTASLAKIAGAGFVPFGHAMAICILQYFALLEEGLSIITKFRCPLNSVPICQVR